MYSTVMHSRVQYSTVQYSTVQYSTVQYSTVQYSTVKNSTVQYIVYVQYRPLANPSRKAQPLGHESLTPSCHI